MVTDQADPALAAPPDGCPWCGFPYFRRLEHAAFCPTVDPTWLPWLNPFGYRFREACSTPGCDRPSKSRGMCRRCYDKWWREGGWQYTRPQAGGWRG